MNKSASQKIMYIIDIFTKFGGVERVLIDKMNYFVKHNYQVILVTYQQGDHPMAFKLDEHVKHIDTNNRFVTLYRYRGIRKYIERIRMLKSFKDNLQQVVDIEKPNYIITTTYLHYCYNTIPKIKTNAKLLIESHISSAIYKYEKRTIWGKILNYFEYCNLKKQIEKFDVLVTLTQGDAEEWSRVANKIKVIPNLVTYYPIELPPKQTKHRIISVGRLHNQKGYDMLIKAFSLISSRCLEWNVELFGEGDLRNYLNSKIIEYGLENRIRINNPSSNIYREYLNSDFFVMSSRYEGLPLVLIEAMSCGIPCVSFRCKYGPEDIITTNHDGILVENGNVNDLADKILWMCNHEKERIEMGNEARITAKKYCEEEIMPLWEELFSTL